MLNERYTVYTLVTVLLIRVKKEEKEIWRGGRKNFEKSQRALLQRLREASRGTGKEEEMEALARAITLREFLNLLLEG